MTSSYDDELVEIKIHVIYRRLVTMATANDMGQLTTRELAQQSLDDVQASWIEAICDVEPTFRQQGK